MSELILNAEHEITAEQYCADGNHQDWLVKCAKKKLSKLRVMSVTTDEWQALVSEANSHRELSRGCHGF